MDETLPPLPSDAITSEEWQQTPASVRNWIGEVLTEVKQLRETVEQLQEIVNRNSQNSSQPHPKIVPSRNQPRNRPGHRANAADNRAIVVIIEHWSMRLMEWWSTNQPVVQGVERCY